MMSSITVGGIWPWRDRDLHLRHVLVEEVLASAGEVLDPRHHVERLSAAIAFAQQRLAGSSRDRAAPRRCAPPAGRPAARR